MSEFTVFDTDVLWADDKDCRELEERRPAIVADYERRLIGAGETILRVLEIPEAVRTPAQNVIAERARTGQAILDSLAAHKQALESIVEDPDLDEIDDSPAKKRFQADLLLGGFSLAWLRLVDEELPGKGLKATDCEIISKRFLAGKNSNTGDSLNRNPGSDEDDEYDGFFEPPLDWRTI